MNIIIMDSLISCRPLLCSAQPLSVTHGLWGWALCRLRSSKGPHIIFAVIPSLPANSLIFSLYVHAFLAFSAPVPPIRTHIYTHRTASLSAAAATAAAERCIYDVTSPSLSLSSLIIRGDSWCFRVSAHIQPTVIVCGWTHPGWAMSCADTQG